MGTVHHHAIVVTGMYDWHQPDWLNIRDAREQAIRAGCLVTEVVLSSVNGQGSFMVCPDGSKEGWTASDIGDSARARFIQWLANESADSDGQPWFAWAELVMRDDDGDAEVLRHFGAPDGVAEEVEHIDNSIDRRDR